MGSARIAIIGAGIGGLAAAVALRRRGVDVHVYEQATALGEVGAGVSLTSNALRVIERLELLPVLAGTAVTLPRGMQLYRHDGAHIGGSAATATPGRNIHRADLIDVFHTAIGDGRLHLGARLAGWEPTASGVRLRFADGAPVEVDGVVGADGIHSAVRRAIVAEGPPVFSGMVAYRGLVPAERLPGWPVDRATMFLGEGRHLLVFPVRRRELLNFVAFVPTDDEMRESWSAPGDPEALRRAFAGWADEVVRMTGAVDRTFRWGLYDRDPLERWTSGRVTLLGDAAHAMLPHAGQGANQSIEDGAALAVALEGRGADGVPTAFAEYEETRRTRTAAIQLFARRLGLEYDARRSRAGDDELDRRDERLASNGAIEDWITHHDVEREAAANVKRVVRPEQGPLDQSPHDVLAFMELKTVWHPVGQ